MEYLVYPQQRKCLITVSSTINLNDIEKLENEEKTEDFNQKDLNPLSQEIEENIILHAKNQIIDAQKKIY